MRVAVLGLTHDHIWSNLRNLAGAEIVAAAEPDAKLRERFASELERKAAKIRGLR